MKIHIKNQHSSVTKTSKNTFTNTSATKVLHVKPVNSMYPGLINYISFTFGHTKKNQRLSFAYCVSLISPLKDWLRRPLM